MYATFIYNWGTLPMYQSFPANRTIQFPIVQFSGDGVYTGTWVTWCRFIPAKESNHFHEPPKGMQEMVDKVLNSECEKLSLEKHLRVV